MEHARVTLASDEWLAEVARIFSEILTANPAAFGQTPLRICEVFTKVPETLDPSGRASRAWHGTIAEGRADIRDGEIDHQMTDLKFAIEYDAALPLARKLYRPDGGDSDLVAAYRDELLRNGRAKIWINEPRITAETMASLDELHNRLVAVTR